MINAGAHIDRPDDKGEEVLSKSDIDIALADFAVGEEYAVLKAALALDHPAPEEGRGAVLKRILPLALPWLDEVSHRETLERMTQDKTFRRSMRAMVRKPFYDDFGIPIRPPS